MRPAGTPNLQWMADAAALVIGALVVAGLMSSRVALRSTPASTPHPTATPVVDYGPPPAGVPLFYVGDPNHPGWYVGFDWNAVPRGTVKLAQPLDDFTNLLQAPDGSAFFVDANGKPPSTGQTLDRLGKPQVTFPVPVGTRQLVWADDNRHLCSIAYQNGNLVLSWHVPAYTSNVAVVAKEPDPAHGEGNDIGIVACAFATDQRAVLVRSSSLHVTEYWVMNLGNGRVMAHAAIPAGVANVVASADGQFIAQNSLRAFGYLGAGAKKTTVRDLSTGEVTNLDPSMSVVAFSGDDKVVLVAKGGLPAGFPSHLATVELATGKVLWSYDGPDEMATFFVEPVGAGFAILLQDPKDQAPHPRVWVVMTYVQGRSLAIPGQFVRP